MNTNKVEIAQLAVNLAALGVSNAVISPGSRNAPLVKAFSNQPSITCISIVDERSAAFVALGIAQQTKTPTVLICTSGSALLNYAPAMVEAYYQQIPLIVLSADRPSQWVDQGDGQCMNQKNVFSNYSKGFWEFLELHSSTNNWYNSRIATEAFHTAAQQPRGPVHINIPLSEPLYGQTDQSPLYPQIVEVSVSTPQLNADAYTELAKGITDAKKVMVIVGQHTPDTALSQAVHSLSKLNQAVILTETTANLFGNGFIDQVDRVLATIPKENLTNYAPELLITFGGMVVSKRLKAILRAQPNIVHWHISEDDKIIDTYQKLSKLFLANPTDALAKVAQLATNNSSEYRNSWQAINDLAKERHVRYSQTVPYSDFQVFEYLLKQLPNHCQLQLGNSTVVRYAQLFDNNTNIDHYCNRGISGN